MNKGPLLNLSLLTIFLITTQCQIIVSQYPKLLGGYNGHTNFSTYFSDNFDNLLLVGGTTNSSDIVQSNQQSVIMFAIDTKDDSLRWFVTYQSTQKETQFTNLHQCEQLRNSGDNQIWCLFTSTGFISTEIVIAQVNNLNGTIIQAFKTGMYVYEDSKPQMIINSVLKICYVTFQTYDRQAQIVTSFDMIKKTYNFKQQIVQFNSFNEITDMILHRQFLIISGSISTNSLLEGGMIQLNINNGRYISDIMIQSNQDMIIQQITYMSIGQVAFIIKSQENESIYGIGTSIIENQQMTKQDLKVFKAKVEIEEFTSISYDEPNQQFFITYEKFYQHERHLFIMIMDNQLNMSSAYKIDLGGIEKNQQIITNSFSNDIGYSFFYLGQVKQYENMELPNNFGFIDKFTCSFKGFNEDQCQEYSSKLIQLNLAQVNSSDHVTISQNKEPIYEYREYKQMMNTEFRMQEIKNIYTRQLDTFRISEEFSRCEWEIEGKANNINYTIGDDPILIKSSDLLYAKIYNLTCNHTFEVVLEYKFKDKILNNKSTSLNVPFRILDDNDEQYLEIYTNRTQLIGKHLITANLIIYYQEKIIPEIIGTHNFTVQILPQIQLSEDQKEKDLGLSDELDKEISYSIEKETQEQQKASNNEQEEIDNNTNFLKPVRFYGWKQEQKITILKGDMIKVQFPTIIDRFQREVQINVLVNQTKIENTTQFQLFEQEFILIDASLLQNNSNTDILIELSFHHNNQTISTLYHISLNVFEPEPIINIPPFDEEGLYDDYKNDKDGNNSIDPDDQNNNEQHVFSPLEAYITRVTFRGEITIYFSQPINIPKNLNVLQREGVIQVEFRKEKTITEVRWEFIEFQERYFIILLRPDQDTSDIGLTDSHDYLDITFKNNLYFTDQINNRKLETTKISHQLVSYVNFQDKSTSTTSSFSSTMTYIGGSTVVSTFLIQSSIGLGYSYLYSFLNTIQVLSFMPLVSLKMPSFLVEFFYNISQFNLMLVDITPQIKYLLKQNFLNFIYFTTLSLNFQRMKTQNILINCGDFFLVIFVTFCIQILLVILIFILSYLKQTDNKIFRLTQRIKAKIGLRGYLTWIYCSFMNLICGCLLNLRVFNFQNLGETFTSFLSLFVFIGSMCLLFWTFCFLLKNQDKLLIDKKCSYFKGFFVGVNIHRSYGALFYHLILLARGLIFLFITFIFWDYPLLKYNLCTLYISLCFVFYVYLSQPFINPIENKIELFNQVMTFIAYITAFPLSSGIKIHNSEIRRYSAFVLIGQFGLLSFVNIGYQSKQNYPIIKNVLIIIKQKIAEAKQSLMNKLLYKAQKTKNTDTFSQKDIDNQEQRPANEQSELKPMPIPRDSQVWRRSLLNKNSNDDLLEVSLNEKEKNLCLNKIKKKINSSHQVVLNEVIPVNKNFRSQLSLSFQESLQTQTFNESKSLISICDEFENEVQDIPLFRQNTVLQKIKENPDIVLFKDQLCEKDTRIMVKQKLKAQQQEVLDILDDKNFCDNQEQKQSYSLQSSPSLQDLPIDEYENDIEIQKLKQKTGQQQKFKHKDQLNNSLIQIEID